MRYATIEEFTTEFVGAVRERRTERFKEGFRSADVVLIDDVQFLAGRARRARSSSTPSTPCSTPAASS